MPPYDGVLLHGPNVVRQFRQIRAKAIHNKSVARLERQ